MSTSFNSALRLLAAFSLAAAGAVTSTASDFFHTLIRRNSGLTDRLHAVAASPDRAVACGDRGALAVSVDGISWMPRNSGVETSLRAAAFSAAAIWVVGDEGVILKSADGAAWTRVHSGATNDLHGVASLGGTLVAVGANGQVLVSTNGVDFVDRSIPGGATLRAAAAGELFAAAGDRGTLLTSADGWNWLQHPGVLADLTTVQVDGRKVLFAGKGGVVGRADEGGIALGQPPVLADFTALALSRSQAGTEFIMLLDEQGNWWRTIPGFTEPWRLFASSPGAVMNSMAIFKRAKVAAGEAGIILSTPVWTRVKPPGSHSAHLAIYGSGRFVVGSTGPEVMVSSNGLAWRTDSVPLLQADANGGAAQSINALFHKNGTYLLGSRASDGLLSRGQFLVSTNVESWTAVAGFPTNQMVSGFGWGGGVFVASTYTVEWKGSASTQTYYLWTSADGAEWTAQPAQIRFSDLEHFNGAYYAANRTGVYRSTNLGEWNRVADGADRISRLDDMLVAAGAVSNDGTNWVANDFFPGSWGAQPIRNLLQAGDAVLTIVGSSAVVGTLNHDRKWEHEFGFADNFAMDFAYGNQRFIVVSLAGEIIASEPLPLELSAKMSPAGVVTISSSGPMLLEKTSGPNLEQWEPFGSVSADAPVALQVEPGKTILLRGSQVP